jgi:signal transduction histidine kinase
MLAYAGRGSGVTQRISLSGVIEGMRPLLEAAYPEGVNNISMLALDIPLLAGDPGQIGQVVLNLVMNSAEACRSGDAIVISTGVVQLTASELAGYRYSDRSQPGSYVYVRVEDTGCGMDVQTVERMFDPFFSTKFTGRGLGLAAVLGIIRSHSGAVKVASTPGAGTEITTIFPALT